MNKTECPNCGHPVSPEWSNCPVCESNLRVAPLKLIIGLLLMLAGTAAALVVSFLLFKNISAASVSVSRWIVFGVVMAIAIAAICVGASLARNESSKIKMASVIMLVLTVLAGSCAVGSHFLSVQHRRVTLAAQEAQDEADAKKEKNDRNAIAQLPEEFNKLRQGYMEYMKTHSTPDQKFNAVKGPVSSVTHYRGVYDFDDSFDEEGNSTRHSYAERDADGYITSLGSYGSYTVGWDAGHNNVTSLSSDYTTYTFRYNDNGELISSTVSTSYGSPQTYSYSDYEYDEYGNWIRRNRNWTSTYTDWYGNSYSNNNTENEYRNIYYNN
ncbi:MAG: hypothetical protein K2M79_02790 [Muribaculaceae bacterium]|nr:hypothetical protein [Muribaculaceae bacterium]